MRGFPGCEYKSRQQTLILPLSLSKDEATRLHAAQLANETSNIERPTPNTECTLNLIHCRPDTTVSCRV